LPFFQDVYRMQISLAGGVAPFPGLSPSLCPKLRPAG
jgi:hypothetical protein